MSKAEAALIASRVFCIYSIFGQLIISPIFPIGSMSCHIAVVFFT